jgi:hypothetical protein
MPVKCFARFKYNTAEYVEKLKCPILFIHSKDDETVPFVFAEKLYRIANEPKKIVEIYGGHNDGFLLSSDIYKNAWVNWLNELTSSQNKIDTRTG